MKAFVTGGAGFIGSHLVDGLVERGHQVVAFDDMSSGFEENLHRQAQLVIGSITRYEDVVDAMAGCDVVFHLAAHRAVFRSVEHPLTSNEANITGTLNVLEAARRCGIERVVSASSSSVYGGAEQLPTPEDAPKLPRSPYAVAKLTGEHYMRVYAELFDMTTVSLRYFNVFGPRMRPGGQYALVVPLFIEALRTGERPVVHGDGLQSRDFTYVTDVVAANLAAATAPSEQCAGKAYNVGRGETHSLLELLAHLGEIMGVGYDPVFTGSRPGDVRHTSADPTAAARDLGFTCQVGFYEGLRAMLHPSAAQPTAA